MRRRCSICGRWTWVDVEVQTAEFHQRFEGADILESVIVCRKCDDEILEAQGDLPA